MMILKYCILLFLLGVIIYLILDNKESFICNRNSNDYTYKENNRYSRDIRSRYLCRGGGPLPNLTCKDLFHHTRIQAYRCSLTRDDIDFNLNNTPISSMNDVSTRGAEVLSEIFTDEEFFSAQEDRNGNFFNKVNETLSTENAKILLCNKKDNTRTPNLIYCTNLLNDNEYDWDLKAYLGTTIVIKSDLDLYNHYKHFLRPSFLNGFLSITSSIMINCINQWMYGSINVFLFNIIHDNINDYVGEGLTLKLNPRALLKMVSLGMMNLPALPHFMKYDKNDPSDILTIADKYSDFFSNFQPDDKKFLNWDILY